MHTGRRASVWPWKTGTGLASRGPATTTSTTSTTATMASTRSTQLTGLCSRGVCMLGAHPTQPASYAVCLLLQKGRLSVHDARARWAGECCTTIPAPASGATACSSFPLMISASAGSVNAPKYPTAPSGSSSGQRHRQALGGCGGLTTGEAERHLPCSSQQYSDDRHSHGGPERHSRDSRDAWGGYKRMSEGRGPPHPPR